MSQREKILLIVVGILLIVVIGIVFAIYTEYKTTKASYNLLEVSFLDVGQGDAIFIQAPNGNQMLIDGGRNEEVLQQLAKKMSWYDRTIDVVLATHPDADHIGGLNEVFKRYKIFSIIRSGVETDKETEAQFLQKADKEIGTTTVAYRGMKIILDEQKGVYFEVLAPNDDVRTWETNDASIVGKLVYGSTCFILMGDAPQKIEYQLITLDKVSLGNDLDCQVLKAGHHGSRTSTSEAFLKAVTPEYAVISAGKENKYGHPHREVIDLLSKYHVQVFQTSQNGNVNFFSNGENITIK